MSTGKLVTSNGEKVVMPEKVPQPDKEAMEKEIERIGEEIKALTKKMVIYNPYYFYSLIFNFMICYVCNKSIFAIEILTLYVAF